MGFILEITKYIINAQMVMIYCWDNIYIQKFKIQIDWNIFDS